MPFWTPRDYLARLREKLANGRLLDRVSELIDDGLELRERGDLEMALGRFSLAAEMVRSQAALTPDALRALASCLMNQANTLNVLGRREQCGKLLEESLRYMKETTGQESPEVATVLQSLGNLRFASGQVDQAIDYHLQAYVFRCQALGKDHEDVATSAYNIAHIQLSQRDYYHAMPYAEEAASIFRQAGSQDRRFRMADDVYRQLRERSEGVCCTPSGYGQILLVLYDAPKSNRLFDNPQQHLALAGFGHVIVRCLEEAWNDMLHHRSAVPVLLLSFPGLEEMVQFAMSHSVAKTMPSSLLQHVPIPATTRHQDDAAKFRNGLQLMLVRKRVVDWLKEHSVRTIMVKPVNNQGATLDRRILAATANDDRPILVEGIEYDGGDGPLTGLYSGDDPRPGIRTTREWKNQGYIPQEDDIRATGTMYFDVQTFRQQFCVSGASGLTPLDEWSLHPLMSAAGCLLEEQLDVFEEAFRDLLLLIKSRLVSCPRERGERAL